MVDQTKSPVIGLLFSDTGVTSEVERSQRYGAEMAISKINKSGGVLGAPVEMRKKDLGGDPDRFRTYVEHLIKNEGVRMFVGCYMSHTRKAVIPSIERSDALLFYPTPYEGFEYSPNIFYGGPAPNQNSAPLAAYLIKNYGPRVVFVGSDYIYPHESNHVMRLLYKEHGGEVVDEVYLPLYPSDSDLRNAALTVERCNPDVVFSTVVGHGTSQFYQEVKRVYVGRSSPPIASLTTSEAEIHEMPLDVAKGSVVAAPYFSALCNQDSLKFMRECREFFPKGVAVTAWSEAAFYQTMLLLKSIESAGTLDPLKIKESVYGMQLQAPQGTVFVDKKNNHTHLYCRIAQVDDQGAFNILWSSEEAISPDPYVVAHSLQDWANKMPGG